MRLMNHPNVCGLKAYFYSQGDGGKVRSSFLKYSFVLEQRTYPLSPHFFSLT